VISKETGDSENCFAKRPSMDRAEGLAAVACSGRRSLIVLWFAILPFVEVYSLVYCDRSRRDRRAATDLSPGRRHVSRMGRAGLTNLRVRHPTIPAMGVARRPHDSFDSRNI